MRQLIKRPPIFFKILRSLRFLTKLFKLDKKIDQDWQTRQILLQHPTASQLLFQRKQPEIEAELLNNSLLKIEIAVLILQGGKDTPDALARSQAYSKLIPQAKLKIIAHAESNLPQSCVGLVVGEVKDFIGNR